MIVNILVFVLNPKFTLKKKKKKKTQQISVSEPQQAAPHYPAASAPGRDVT